MPQDVSEAVTAKDLLHQFSSAQQIRILNYKQLEKGFEAVLHSQNDADYKYAAKLKDTQCVVAYSLPNAAPTCRALMAQVTVAFQVCSETINAAETGLRSLERHDLADMLRVVQTNEQEKLRMTLILQALRQSCAHKNFSWVSRGSANMIQTKSGKGTLLSDTQAFCMYRDC